ncbi:type I restriction endonuclease subunit S [Klebsiella michiganensis]|uniref:restriction endonuclease subunit S n=1 Tax=Klebsiella grimontii TaxID=2058152 RepID=UPI0019398B4F|nr:restriction endonuclease subunit S [Klebsiella grimontii]MBW5985548.1 type I restriction endonuclease subunit S [Klebsiella michiganensis]MBM1116185.1 restriction endonuclease subunit S [Klebsiella grimontii]MBW6001509.1 type I restriction endonuclease subunit S [Klebsiella michiganensis]MBZ6687865.1 restriction endonuclease subunit S [Klebsiella grimontii]MBZ7345942.1 restriction endonuclease subunit S [Klebsiella grimontii]
MAVEKLIVDHIDTWTTALQTRSTAGRGSSGKIDLYGIKKLRELILELAVRGKLVPQDPNDEPASELLKRIAAEKAELVKLGKIKKPKPLPEISEGEKPFELPEGWEWVRLSDLMEVINGRAYKKHEMLQEGTPLLRVGNLFTSNEWYYSDLELDENKYIDNGDLIYAWSASFGPFIWTGQKVIYHYHIWKLKLFAEELSDKFFIHYFLLSITEKIKSQGNGIAMLHMTKERMEQQVIALPPVNEQKNIVQKIRELMSLCDQLEQHSLASLDAHQQLVETLLTTLTDSQNADELAENWARISEHFDTLFTTEASIDALKQTILQLAVMGKLVPQDLKDEPASELLKRIAQEKALLVKDGKMKKQKPLPPISDEEKPFELPDGWEWCRLTDIGELARGKSKHRPRNDPALYTNGEYPLVQTGDVARSGGCIRTFSAMYNKVGLNQSRLWPKGTLCITIAANIADSGILEFDACFPDSVVGFTPYDKEIPVIYFHYFMITIKSSLEKFAPSTAQKNINLDVLSQVFVPCPPLKEFLRIVGKTRMLLKQCEQIKSCFKSAQQTQLHLADALTDAAIN